MALTKRSENNIVYLEVKHYCLWRALKKQVAGCDEVEANNPSTGRTVTKYGYRFDTVSGVATKLLKYDTEQKYQKRYFGFKLHLVDGAETYVIDMPYSSQILRRFLRVARNIDWDLPLSLTIFKGKKKEGAGVEETGIWFQQAGETVKAYYMREEPHGMPAATQDPDTHEWDFKAQHRWLVERLKSETIPDIEAAARRSAPPIEPSSDEHTDDQPEPDGVQIPPCEYISDDDVPF
jgi:hypothetical protein